jgi:peptidoglycan/LPS O-acetylase OafA/YrhL
VLAVSLSNSGRSNSLIVITCSLPAPKGTISNIQSPAKDYLPALTGLRFILALWVVLHHISGQGMMLESWANSLPFAARTIVHGGYLAVQSFFVLSGFVMARTYANARWGGKDLVKYGAARLARIYPVYLLSLIVVAPFIVDTMLEPATGAGRKATLLADYVFVMQGWTGTLGVGWNTPAWSLSCEFFFYLLFPLIFPLLRNAGRRVIALVLAACLITPVLLAHAEVPWDWKPIHHFSDFVAGIAAARLYRFLAPRMKQHGSWLYLPAAIAGALLIVFPQVMDGTYGDLKTGLRPLNVLALAGLALGGGFTARVLSTQIADYLGKVSYSMYILHVPILWWFGRWAMHASVFGVVLLSPGAASLLYLVLVIAVSGLSFAWVETPANRWIRGYVANRLVFERPRTAPVWVSEATAASIANITSATPAR